jgi:hypothetical protein
MNKVGIFFLFMSSSILFSQSTKSSLQTVKFEDDSLHLNFSPFKVNALTYDFSKRETPFSLYNPMPGLNAFKINSRYYYAMDNTSRLLGIEMKDYEKEPIFPDEKKTTLCEAVFSQVMNSLFEK